MDRWTGIEEVVAIAATGSFVRGAAKLGTSTSHMSRAIADLERRIGSQIFIRTTRRVLPTPAGRALIDQFRQLMTQRDDALLAISSDGMPRGEVRITCSVALGERFVARIARDFAYTHPDVTVNLELTNQVVNLLEEGYDLAIRTGTVSDSSLVATHIASRKMYLCAAPTYLASHGFPTTIDALDAHECLLGTSSTWRFSIDGADRDYYAKGKWRCNSGTAVTEAAVGGYGICQLPDIYVIPYLRSGALRTLLEDHSPTEDPVWAVYPHRRYLLPKVRLLIDQLRRELPIALQSHNFR